MVSLKSRALVLTVRPLPRVSMVAQPSAVSDQASEEAGPGHEEETQVRRVEGPVKRYSAVACRLNRRIVSLTLRVR